MHDIEKHRKQDSDIKTTELLLSPRHKLILVGGYIVKNFTFFSFT